MSIITLRSVNIFSIGKELYLYLSIYLSIYLYIYIYIIYILYIYIFESHLNMCWINKDTALKTVE